MIDSKEQGSPMRAFSVIAVVAIGLALRLYQLGTESLWIDEGYSLRDAAASLSIFDARPLYFSLLHWWMKFGQSEAWLRLPSVVFGVATILMVYVVGRRLHGHTPAAVAALLVAVSPLHVNHSQEIRMYSLLTFLVTAGVLLFLWFVETGGLRRLIPLALIGFMSFLVFPLAVFMFLTYTVYLLFSLGLHRRAAVWWITTQGAMAVLAVPWVPKLIEVTKSYGDAWTWRLAKPGLIDVAWLMRDFGIWRIASSHKIALMAADAYAVGIIGLAIVGAFYGLRRQGRQTLFTLMWLLIPVAATLVMSRTVTNVWITRYMIYASPALYLLIGLGLAVLARSRPVYTLALVGVLLLPLARLGVYYHDSERPEWRQAVQYIRSSVQPSDSIGLYRSGNKYAFDYYYHGRAAVFALGAEGLTRAAFTGWSEPRIAAMMSPIPADSRRVWFVFSFHEDTGGLAIEEYVRRHYKVLGITDFERVRIYETEPIEKHKRVLLTYEP